MKGYCLTATGGAGEVSRGTAFVFLSVGIEAFQALKKKAKNVWNNLI